MKKVCKQCGRELDINCFHKNKTYTSGHINKCKDCIKLYTKKYLSEHKEERKKYRKEYYIKNREEGIKKSIEWGRNNKVLRKIAKNKWRASNKEKTNHLTRQYNYRRRGAVGNHTIDEWKKLCNLYQWKCACCGIKAKLTEDHVIPLSKGGSDLIENIQPLCLSCNSKKGNKHSIKYILNK